MEVYFSSHNGLGDPELITIENYKELIIKIGIGSLPDTLKKGHQFLSANIDQYYSNASIKDTIEDYLRDLNTYVSNLPDKKRKEIFHQDKGYSGHKWTGNKYKYTKDLKTSEIAKLIKKELEIEFENEAKFSVVSDVFSGGSSIDIKITEVTANPYTDHFLEALKAGKSIEEYNRENADNYNRWKERFNDEFKTLIKKVERISNQYNFDDSDSQTDYFHVNYYSHVGFDEYKYLIKHFPESPDAKRHIEFNKKWDEGRAKSKAKADARKGKFKKRSLVWLKAEMHKSWHKYKLANGMYLAIVIKSPNGRAFSSSYSIQILEDIKVLGESTIEYHKKHGADKYYITNEYGTFYKSSSLTAYEENLLALDDPAAKIDVKQETQAVVPAKPAKEKKVKSTKKKVEAKPIEVIPYEPVTLENYLQRPFEINNWPENLKRGHEFVTGETAGFKNIELASEDATIQEVINTYIKNLNLYLSSQSETQAGYRSVREISPAVKIIRRYAGLHGKRIAPQKLYSFIKTLQKAMVTQQIRAADPHQQVIYHIQDELVDAYNNTDPEEVKEIQFTIAGVEQYKKIVEGEKELVSVKFLKRYVNLIGRKQKDKQLKLHKEIAAALQSGKIPATDVLLPQIQSALNNLHLAYSNNGKLQISDMELSGLQGLGFIPMLMKAVISRGVKKIAANAVQSDQELTGLGCACEAEIPVATTAVEIPTTAKNDNAVMGVNEAKALEFDLLGLDGAYLELIGEACRPTSFLIYGPGGSGKSSLTLQFSNYLAQKGNRVLYVAGEQYGTPIFTKMLGRLKIQDSENFAIVKRIGDHDLKKYDLIAIDSKDSLNYSLDDFIHQREKYPHLSFVILSQGTKAGGFTGTEKWRNEVDTLVYCERLKAYTNRDKNRWGGSSEVDILSLIQNYS